MMFIYVIICVGNHITIVMTYKTENSLILSQKKSQIVIILIFFIYLCAMK